MCVSCGCGRVNDNHGDPRNLTMDQIQQAARASGSTPQDVAKNIEKSVNQQSSRA